MRIERRRERRQPELNMQSLPDLIFTVLFFFMLVTTMRSVPVKVDFRAPEGSEIVKLRKNSSTLYVFVGRPVQAYRQALGDSVVIQVNDRYVPLQQVTAAVNKYCEDLLPDEREQMTVSLKVDRSVPMGVVSQVKMALRQAGALKVHYSAVKTGTVVKNRR